MPRRHPTHPGGGYRPRAPSPGGTICAMDAGMERSHAHVAIPALELLVEVLARPVADEGDGEERFYSHLAGAVCRLASMRRALIFRYDDATRRVRVAGTHGVDPAAFQDTYISVELAPLAATALAEDRVVEALPGSEHPISPQFAELAGTGALVYVPLTAGDRWPGVMLLEPEPEVVPLDAALRDFLWALGKTLALVAMARIATFHGERARQLEDRLDLARDIHDRVIQRLFGVSLALTRPLDDAARGALRRRGPDRARRPAHRAAAPARAPVAADRHDAGRRVEAVERPPPRPAPQRARRASPSCPRRWSRWRSRSSPRRCATCASTRAGVGDRGARQARERRLRPGGLQRRRARPRRRDRPPGPPGMGLRLAALEAIQVGGVVEFGAQPDGRWQVRLAVPTETVDFA